MFAGLLAYEAGDARRATNLLDDVLALQPVHPEAAVLRARIALEQGNTLHARTLLEDQANLKPDHAGIQEALASAYHMDGHDEEALAALDRADMLGAPEHRVLYNRGLIEEKRGNPDLAISLYRRSVRRMPDWPPASARLRGLGASAYGPTDVSPETSEAPAAQPAMPLPPSPPPASALLPPAGDAADDLPAVRSR